MEFPEELFKNILTYLPHPYKIPPHISAINNDNTFHNFIIDREMYYEDGENPEWINSYIKYKKWIALWHPLPENIN